MDFFSAQEAARKRTSWLVALYALAVMGIIVSVYLVLALGLTTQSETDREVSLWMPELFWGVAAGVSVLVFGGSLFKTLQLSQGGAVVARALGGQLIAPNTLDAGERRLINVVEEMALAAGTSVPQLFVLNDEPGINAFAAGFTPRDAAIGVTRGCIEHLSRDELQGVMAHEFSHIVHGDMRLNLRLMGVLFGILMLTIIGRVLLRTAFISGGGRSRSDKKQGGNPLPLIGLALIVIGYIGVFFANLIKSAIARQREFLADASAVQFTRNPSGIAGALKKIGGLAQGARVNNAHAAEASHLFFGEALGRGLIGIFATHPPLPERIRRLDPAFNSDIAAMMRPPPLDGGATANGLAMGFAPGEAQLDAAAGLLRRLPPALRDDIRRTVGARALVYALLLAPDAAVLAAQMRLLETGDPEAYRELATVRTRLSETPPEARLPLADLTVPALRTLSHAEYVRFRETVTALIEADAKIDLFEFALSQMILRHIEPAFGRAHTATIRYHSVEQALSACATVVAALAIHGTQSAAEAAACYETGMRRLQRRAAPPPLESRHASLNEVSEALKMLSECAPRVKRQVLDACSACVMADGHVALEERELLRTIADAMDVPMPPLATEG